VLLVLVVLPSAALVSGVLSLHEKSMLAVRRLTRRIFFFIFSLAITDGLHLLSRV
jgi:hypothetical protein